jgi:hypothetical protein
VAARANAKRAARRPRGEHLLAAYLAAAVAGLVALRALAGSLDFLGVGWILVLVALPVLPWLLPRLVSS